MRAGRAAPHIRNGAAAFRTSGHVTKWNTARSQFRDRAKLARNVTFLLDDVSKTIGNAICEIALNAIHEVMRHAPCYR